MKLRQPKDPSERLYRRALHAAGVMAAGAGLVWLASSMLQTGHDAASQRDLPETRPGIGKNIEVIAPNLAKNTINQAAASIYTEIGWFGLGAGVLMGLGGAADMIIVAGKLDTEQRQAAKISETELEAHRVPTSRIVEPETAYDPDAATAVIPKIVLLNDELPFADFTSTQVLPRIPSVAV